jgi:hypothetical protein
MLYILIRFTVPRGFNMPEVWIVMGHAQVGKSSAKED